MKIAMLVVVVHLILVGCSKSEQDQKNASSGDRAGYVSEQEQYVESLQQEVSIEDPDALLADLNESNGDNSENAALVSQKSLEGAPVVIPTEPEADDTQANSDDRADQPKKSAADAAEKAEKSEKAENQPNRPPLMTISQTVKSD